MVVVTRGQHWRNQQATLAGTYNTANPYRQAVNLLSHPYVQNAARGTLAATLGAIGIGETERYLRTPPNTPTRARSSTPQSQGPSRTRSRASQRNMVSKRTARSGQRRNPRFTSVKGKSKKVKAAHKSIKNHSVSKKQIKKWNKAAINAKIDLSKMCYQYRGVNQSKTLINVTVFDQEKSNGFHLTALGTALAAEKHSSDAASAIGESRNVVAQTGHQKKRIQVTSSAHFMNNYAVPYWIDVYCMTPNKDQTSGPVDAYESGLVDIGIVDGTGPANDDVFAYPSWSHNMRTMWSTASHKRVCLAPGESVHLGFKKTFTWDPAVTDLHLSEYQENLGAHVFCVRLEGCFGHGSGTTTENDRLGTSATLVDWFVDRKVTWQYDAGGAKYNVRVIGPTVGVTPLANSPIIIGWANNAANTQAAIE